MIITIDGSTGVGKSTVARTVAQTLNFHYVSTGRVYRSLAYGIRSDIAHRQENVIFQQINSLDLRFRDKILIINEIDNESELQNEEIALIAAEIGANPDFKSKVSQKIVQAVKRKNAVVEGRMAGTVVFPDATLKVFLLASQEDRIRRKMHQSGFTYTAAQDALRKRDALVGAIAGNGIIEIDTSGKASETVAHEIVNLFYGLTSEDEQRS